MPTAKKSYDDALDALHRRADIADGRGPGFHFTDREVIALSSWIKGKDQEIANLKRQLDNKTRDEVTPADPVARIIEAIEKLEATVNTQLYNLQQMLRR